MKLPNLFVNAVATWDGKALTKGQKQIVGFQKSVTNLAKAFGVGFAATELVKFGKLSLKAFQEDEAAALRLTRAVDNLGIGFANADISKFIADLERSAGIADDILRPAFQGLLTTTGSLTQSQKLLNDAITISRASGIDLATVSEDLAKGYVGITKGLAKYNTGLTKTELSTKSFNEILGTLLKQSAGAAEAYLGTTAYSMDVLGVATSNASEIIGGGLVDAFAAIGGGTEASDAAYVIEKIATAIAGVTKATGGAIGVIPTLLQKLKSLPKEIFMGFAGAQAGVKLTPTPKPTKTASEISKEEQAKRLAKLEADAAKRAKDLAILQNKQLANAKKQAELEKKRQLAEKAKLALNKAAAVFDLSRIQIAAALKATYDKDERLRLLALQEIENDNGEAALKYIEQLKLLTQEQQTNKLAGITAISESELSSINNLLLAELKRIGTTEMTESEAAAARQEAYAKYNAAIIASGGLAEANFYTEKTQAKLLEISKLAEIDTVAAAQAAYDILNYKTQTDIIARIAAAQKLADDAKYKALQDYLAEAGKPITQTVTTKYVSQGASGQVVSTLPTLPDYSIPDYTDYIPANRGQTAFSPAQSITVIVEGNVLDGNDFTEKVNQALLNSQRTGLSQIAAGALP